MRSGERGINDLLPSHINRGTLGWIIPHSLLQEPAFGCLWPLARRGCRWDHARRGRPPATLVLWEYFRTTCAVGARPVTVYRELVRRSWVLVTSSVA